MMAADRPLLVLHDEEEGHLVYDLVVVVDSQDETLACFPCPVAVFSSPLSSWCCSFAVSGGNLVGVTYDWEDTLFHDTVMQVGGYDFWERQPSPRMRDSEGQLVQWWPKMRSYCSSRPLGDSHKDKPAMLPMGDGSVIRMDTILFNGMYSFETLRTLPGGGVGCWNAVPLPKPPVGRLADNQVEFVTAYLAVGTRVWISVTHKGTFSLDTDTEHGKWQMEGTWLLPFEGRAMYVPELDSVIGLTAKTQLLCACDVVKTGTGTPPVVRHVWKETFPWPWEECIAAPGHHPNMKDEEVASRPRDMPSLAYLGKGKFCICRPMSTKKPHLFDPPIDYDACSLLVVELKRLPGAAGGELLQLAKRGKMSYMWPPQGRRCLYVGFIQPAI